MYPRLSDLIEQGLGIPMPIPTYSFGVMVAVALLTGTWLAARELDRMYDAGQIGGVRVPSESGHRTTTASPSVWVGTLAVVAIVAVAIVAVVAVVTGVLGAKLFHTLENLDAFLLNPVGMVLSSGGLTFWGGLIVAGGALVWMLRQHDLSVARVADATAPSLMLGYGIGRIGCHLAGDDDWGFSADLSSKPDGIPMWLWAESYPNAILGPPDVPVYPTSIYEAVASIALAGLLWTLRTHPFHTGWLFSVYLVLNGIERVLIEQIRVNNTFDLFGLTVAQAERIAVGLVVVGGLGLVRTTRKTASPNAPPHDVPAKGTA